ncbi:MAG: hypothetical protein P4L80_13340, partial [Xanthobacteraceae bacterium]|nr:hypothetical protein [Xanthobacteraceae bacterium]
QIGMGAISNLNVEQAMWRWVAGFRAALYKEPLVGARGSIVTPFPLADLINGHYSIVLCEIAPNQAPMTEGAQAIDSSQTTITEMGPELHRIGTPE